MRSKNWSKPRSISGVPAADAKWLCNLLNELGALCGTRAQLNKGKSITLEWRDTAAGGGI